MNHLELARLYVDEILNQRRDIIAAWVGGSVARNAESTFSDIDLAFMVASERGDFNAGGGLAINRAGLDTWRDGIYIEAGLVFRQDYLDLDALMNHPFKSTNIHDALILHDPTGFITELQNNVRAIFMQPEWQCKRLQFWLDYARAAVARLQEAIPVGDLLSIAVAVREVTFCVISIHLLCNGITPSSTRKLIQLAAIDPALCAEIAEVEGSLQMRVEDILALEPFLHEAIPLIDPTMGQLPQFLLQKAIWLAQQGHHWAAFDIMATLLIYRAAADGLHANDLTKRAAIVDLTKRWLQTINHSEAKQWAKSAQIAEKLLQQAEHTVLTWAKALDR